MKLRVGNRESIISGLEKVCTQSRRDSSKVEPFAPLLAKQRASHVVVDESTIVNHSKPFISRCNLRNCGTNANKRVKTKGDHIVGEDF